MKRTLDGHFLTYVANHEKVRPLLGGTGEVDLRPVIADPLNFTLEGVGGGYLFLHQYEGTYEGHTIFPPSSSFRDKLKLVLSALEYMFVNTDCEQILTKIPDGYLGADWMATRLGFLEGFRRDKVWNGELGVSYRNITLDRWAVACSTATEQGRAFHDMLERAKKAKGSTLPNHPEDLIHDRMVGVTIKMILAGNFLKALRTYNRWAIFAGYGLISAVSEQPPVVDVQDAVVGVVDGKLEVIQCR